nr:immunoglobulin light chain junction region [Macaca mulatta]MOW43077.1 immunoglobulin light chain junction region [Macaca mulatta]MOW43539.1 immunoglobulin light chain junction region [Macaca mulatta]MOW44342.1 immunoglobulin light chain junction region [Macaca mulatta]MOW44785.1 immunoglobulin light chain junction region [Macaca mulatta]
CQHYNSDPYSF